MPQQREFITKKYPAGKRIVFMDDDVGDIYLNNSPLFKGKSIDYFFNYAFDECKKVGSYIWGVYPVDNPYFMKGQEITTDLRYIVGALYGIINRPSLNSIKLSITMNNGQKEDVERTILYFKNDDRVVRFNRVGFKTTYYGKVGGLGRFEDRLKPMKENSERLKSKYPDYGDIKVRESGMTEFILKKLKPQENEVIEGGKITDTSKYDLVDRENDELIVDKIVVSQKVKGLQSILLTALEDAYIPKIEQKRNDGKPTRGGLIGYDGYTFTLGCGRRRGLGSGEFATNKRNQDVLGAAINYGNAILPKGFQYTTITINKNLQAKKHIDGGNNGMGFITFLGDFTGGNLSVWDRDGKERSLSAKNNLIGFNGAKLPHQTQDFKGERYALIYYKQKQACDVKGYTMRGSGIQTSIPVHQIFVPFEEGKTITDFPLFEKSISEMKQLSSSYKLWGQKELETLMKKYPKYYPMWKNARYEIQKVDIGKMVILYDRGGVYADLDILPNDIKSLNTLKEFDEDAVFGEDDDSVNVELIYSQKGNPMFLQILDYMKEQIGVKSKQKIYDTWKGRYVLQTTGPRMLGRFIKDNKPDIKIIPINLSYDWNKPKKSGTLFTTYHMGSWLKSVNPKLKRRDA